LRRGKRANASSLSVFYLGKPVAISRIGVIIDKKTAKKAVSRNLGKRRVRAALRQLPLPNGDLIVRLYADPQKLEYVDIDEQIRQCLKKLGTIPSKQ
jgi:ribonuclease P protein component